MSYRQKVVLDACVLYPAPVRDILLNLADQDLYDPKWSQEIEEEWLRNLLNNRPDLDKSRLERTIKAMNRAFPEAMIENYEKLIEGLELPDKDDRHVLAMGIKCKADLIVTFNLRDFPKDYVSRFDIEVNDPDSFICRLIASEKELAFKGFENQLKSLKNPPKTREELLTTLQKCGLNKTSELFRG